jgi:hypothetical protein
MVRDIALRFFKHSARRDIGTQTSVEMLFAPDAKRAPTNARHARLPSRVRFLGLVAHSNFRSRARFAMSPKAVGCSARWSEPWSIQKKHGLSVSPSFEYRFNARTLHLIKQLDSRGPECLSDCRDTVPVLR